MVQSESDNQLNKHIPGNRLIRDEAIQSLETPNTAVCGKAEDIPLEQKLLESENMFRSIVENSHAGIFTIDSSFHIIYANNRLAEILGYAKEEIIGCDFRRFLDEPSIRIVADRYIRRQRGEELPSRYEFNFFRKSGELRNAELSSAVIQETTGKIITVGQILDITERKQAEQEVKKAHDELEMRVAERTADLQKANLLLQQEIVQHKLTQEALSQSEIKYRHLIDNANSIIIELDTRGNITFWNKFAEEFFGFKEGEILGRSVIGTIVAPVDSAGRDLAGMIHGLVTIPEKYTHNENENIKRNGERVWMVWTNQPIYDEESRLKEILCIGINRTEQKKAEELSAQQSKDRAAIQERTRLARDLHDAVSQTLFSASLIAEVLPKLWERHPEEGKKRLEEIRQLTRGALAEMRTLLLELRPAALNDTELSDLLRQLGDSITGRARLPVSLEVKGHCDMSPEVKIALYRIAQEALNNVAKHSEATQARVNLDCQNHGVNLTISDNGRGFDINNTLPGSLGLGIMQERAKGIGAQIAIESYKGQGTLVKVRWQLMPRKEKR